MNSDIFREMGMVLKWEGLVEDESNLYSLS